MTSGVSIVSRVYNWQTICQMKTGFGRHATPPPYYSYFSTGRQKNGKWLILPQVTTNMFCAVFYCPHCRLQYWVYNISVYIVHKQDLLNIWEEMGYIESFLEPLNISLDKREKRHDVWEIDILHWGRCLNRRLAGLGSKHGPHVCCTVLQRKKVIYDWRQQIKWNYRCTGTKSNQQCAALGSPSPTL